MTSFSFRDEDRIRLERIEEKRFDPESAVSSIKEFYEKELSKDTTKCTVSLPCSLQTRVNEGLCKSEEGPSLHIAINLPKSVQVCLAALIYYLKDFRLEKVLQITRYCRVIYFTAKEIVCFLGVVSLVFIKISLSLSNCSCDD